MFPLRADQWHNSTCIFHAGFWSTGGANAWHQNLRGGGDKCKMNPSEGDSILKVNQFIKVGGGGQLDFVNHTSTKKSHYFCAHMEIKMMQLN